MEFKEKLREYAKLIVQVGVNVQENQVCFLWSDVDSAPLTRLIADEAYNTGAKIVHVNYVDMLVKQLTFQRAADEVFKIYPEWNKLMNEQLRDEGACFIYIDSTDPDLLAGVPAGRIANDRKARGVALKSFDQSLSAGHNCWTVACAANVVWCEQSISK